MFDSWISLDKPGTMKKFLVCTLIDVKRKLKVNVFFATKAKKLLLKVCLKQTLSSFENKFFKFSFPFHSVSVFFRDFQFFSQSCFLISSVDSHEDLYIQTLKPVSFIFLTTCSSSFLSRKTKTSKNFYTRVSTNIVLANIQKSLLTF